MDWLSQNWVLVLLAAGLALFFFRGGFGGFAGGTGHHTHAGGDNPGTSATPAMTPEAAVDPVNGELVRPAGAPMSLYQGKIYYFASKENRERFEASPQDFSNNAAGHPLQATPVRQHAPKRRRGCC